MIWNCRGFRSWQKLDTDSSGGLSGAVDCSCKTMPICPNVRNIYTREMNVWNDEEPIWSLSIIWLIPTFLPTYLYSKCDIHRHPLPVYLSTVAWVAHHTTTMPHKYAAQCAVQLVVHLKFTWTLHLDKTYNWTSPATASAAKPRRQCQSHSLHWFFSPNLSVCLSVSVWWIYSGCRSVCLRAQVLGAL